MNRFWPGNVLVSSLIESALMASIGDIVGCFLALPLNGVVPSTTNWGSFSERGFAFRVTPGLLVAGMAFAVEMWTLGRIFPAREASKVEVVHTLR